jgi:hypothetical protein
MIDDQQNGYGGTGCRTVHFTVGGTDHSFVSFVQHEQIWSGSKGSRDLAHMGVLKV